MRNSLSAIAILMLITSTAHANYNSNTTTQSSVSSEANFSYNYFEARIGVSPTTYGLGGNISFHPNAHIRLEADSKFDSDFNSSLAVGFHAPITNWADVYGELGARVAKQPGRFNNRTKVGVELLVGGRQWLGPQFEVNAEIGHLTIDGEKDIFGSVGGRFHATEEF